VSYDVIIIGSGAGGGTMARALADSGARILVIERGDRIPQEQENWSPEAVWKQLRYRAKERWIDADGKEFLPYTHYGVGGNTKFWGSVLYRLRREDFQAVEHADGVSPAWPIDYDTLAPYYDRAEQMYHVHGEAGHDPTEPERGPYPYEPIPHSPGMQGLVDGLRRMDLHPSPLPLGLINPGQESGCQLCNTCNSFPCRIHAKSDAEVCGIKPAVLSPAVDLWTNTTALRLIPDATGSRIDAVEVEREGTVARLRAGTFIVSCGAVNSAVLLLRSGNGTGGRGLANSSGLVGKRYMAHLATMMQGFNPLKKNETVFQKTVAINDFYLRGPNSPYPLGQIQSQGRTHGIMAKVVGDTMSVLGITLDPIPLWAYDYWVSRGVDWLVMSEDLPRDDNRVTLDSSGAVRVHYRPNNVRPHEELVGTTRRILHRLGFIKVMAHSHRTQNTTHQCGTLVFGHDPKTSVLDTFCRTHDIDNLYVVDASFFPSSAAVNPGLTIVAQALRVADHIQQAPGARPQSPGARSQAPRSQGPGASSKAPGVRSQTPGQQ
jgi:choline dehydrogenase-like flavoprotein